MKRKSGYMILTVTAALCIGTSLPFLLGSCLLYTSDVYKRQVCILNEKGEKFEAKYGVLTPELEELHQLLLTPEVKEVTMESTSIYWLSLIHI